ncbi:MAG: proline dehydrogenase family protein [Thermodesulfobacteriota bacterium]
MTAHQPLSPETRDAEVLALGRELLRRMGDRVPGLFDTRWWVGRALDWAMRDPAFKTDLFRFVDVFPSLGSSRQVARHVQEYLLTEGRELPGLPAAALKIAGSEAAAPVTARLVRRNVEALARRFILGAEAAQALPGLEALHRQGLAFTVDLLGEATLSEGEADACRDRYRDLIANLPARVASWPPDGRIDRGHLGPLPRANVSLKVSALDPRLEAADPAGGVARLARRLLPLLLEAQELGASVHLDLEQWELHDLTFDLFEEVASHPGLRSWPHLGMTLQAYLRGSRRDLERLLSIARARQAPVGVRLAKGAYWDAEVVRSRQHGYPCPVFTDKAATDARFEELTVGLLREPQWFQAAFASHNLRSLAHAAVAARELGLPTEAIEIQTLAGMAEPERLAFRDLGYRVRVYAPVGELVPGMAYLVRRLLENTSTQGFLRLTHREREAPEVLFARPAPESSRARTPRQPLRGVEVPFENCPFSDFADRNTRGAFSAAVAAVWRRLPLVAPVVVAGRTRPGQHFLEHPCPGTPDRTATRVALASSQDVAHAVEEASRAWPGWRDEPIEKRAALLERLADRLEADRLALAAVQVAEAGKPWREADADVAEAVDYCRYYARRAPAELGPRALGGAPGEENTLWYEGRGPTAVIAPWNFPLAILTGMASAALVAGNPVLLKPAEQASGTGYTLFEHLLAAGFPAGVVCFLPGLGEEVGARLVGDPRVATVAFTGSKAVGLAILRAAGETAAGQRHVKRVVCEMGGKNAIVVDETADVDAAVAGVLQGAFGYAGQKCSACSRVITVGTAHEPFARRLADACRSLPQLPPDDPGCRLGPVVDRESYARLQTVLADPGPGAEPLFVGAPREGGWYVPPAVYRVSSPDHPLMRDELFGPVVALCRAETFEEGLQVATATDYALTGAVYSRTPSHLALATRKFRVGNLYLNRTCTGAVVGRQPFGGFGLSGGGTKAGGPGYLLHFADPRVVCENTVRRGFSPGVQI